MSSVRPAGELRRTQGELPDEVGELAVVRVATGLQFGGADLLVNNAGVMLPAPIEQLRADQ